MSRQPTEREQAEYLQKVQSEVQNQMMQEMMGKITEMCFKKCTGKSGNYLDRSEQSCLSNCSDRYMEGVEVVKQTLIARQNRS